MSKAMFQRRRSTTNTWGSPKLGLVLTVLPMLILLASILGVAWFCRTLLFEAERVDMDLPSLLPLFLGVFGISVVSCLLTVTHGVRLQRRLAGPTLRLIAGMQRVRVGDLTFRIHLRRGDYLSEVAFEFNKVIDWLNENPPEGARTGSDVVDVYAPDAVDLVDPGFDEIGSGLNENDVDADLRGWARDAPVVDLDPDLDLEPDLEPARVEGEPHQQHRPHDDEERVQ